LSNSHMVWVDQAPLLQLSNVLELTLSNVKFTSNYIRTPNLNRFAFIAAPGLETARFQDQTFFNNTFEGNVELIRFPPQNSSEVGSGELSIEVYKLNISNNSNVENEKQHKFSYLTMKGYHLKDFNVKEVEFSKNFLSGSVFYIQCRTLSHYSSEKVLQTPPKMITFSNTNIINNSRILAMSFLQFSSNFNSEEKKNSLQLIQPYIIKVSDSNIQRNEFKNSRTDKWYSEESLFEVEETQLYLDNVMITDNLFIFYSVISLEQKPSTVIITSSQVRNNNFVTSQFIQSDYLPSLRRAYLGIDIVDSSEPLYRFLFVYNTTFENLGMVSSILISSENGLVILKNNTFNDISMQNS